MSHDGNHLLHVGQRHHLLATLQAFTQQLGNAPLDVGHDVVPVQVVLEMPGNIGQILLQHLVSIFIDDKRHVVQVDVQSLFSLLFYFRFQISY